MKKYILTVLFCVGGLGGFSQEAVSVSTPNHEQDIIARFSAVNTLSSQFVQEKHMTLLADPVISKGKFSFSKNPAQIRWEYTEPFQNGFLLTNGKTFRLEKGIKKPAKHSFARNIAAQMMMWLTFDLAELSKTYNVVYFEGGVHFIPKEKITVLEKITVWFSTENPQALDRIRLDEPGGDYTVLIFQNPQINPVLPKEQFQ